jgi:hypothetical protein
LSDLKEYIKEQLDAARNDYVQVGGSRALKSGERLWPLMQKSFANFGERANIEYFQMA